MRRRVTKLLLGQLAFVAALGLVGCGSDGPEGSSSRNVDRRAASANVAMCVGDRAWDRVDGATVKFDGSKVNGPGPFPLEGNWCDETDGDFFWADVTQGDQALVRVFAKNFLGKSTSIYCTETKTRTKWINLDIGGRHTYDRCNGVILDVVREPDVGGVPQLQYWIRTR